MRISIEKTNGKILFNNSGFSVKELLIAVAEVAEQISTGVNRNGKKVLLKRRLSTIRFSKRTENCIASMKKNGIKTVADLVNCSPNDLLMYRNFGRGCLIEIERFLDSCGLKLKENDIIQQQRGGFKLKSNPLQTT